MTVRLVEELHQGKRQADEARGLRGVNPSRAFRVIGWHVGHSRITSVQRKSVGSWRVLNSAGVGVLIGGARWDIGYEN
jgi:hypothetical protein